MATYTKERIISDKGAFSVVWEAVRDDGTRWAMKVLREGLGVEDAKRFQREAKIASNLDHPSIVKIVGLGLHNTPPWFTMPIAECCLRDWMGDATEEEKIAAFLRIAEAVAHSHASEVIHRDLKPENVLMFRDKKTKMLVPVVSDFGLGKALDSQSTTLTSSNIGMGTLAYLAPEQLTNAKAVDHRADIYSLGKMLYELLTGRYPFPTLDFEEVPDRFAYHVRTACANSPERRFQKLSDFISAIESAMGHANQFAPKVDDVKQAMALAAADRKNIGAFARVLLEQVKSSGILEQVVPKIPRHVLTSLLADHEDLFRPVVEAFAKIRPEAFEYCDEIADFFQAVFEETASLEIREIALERVFYLGPAYNRWHVGGVFGSMLGKLKSPPLIQFVAEMFRKSPADASWNRGYLDEAKLPRLIADALPPKG